MGQTSRSPVFAFGPFRVDAQRRVLARDGQPVAVSGKALDILVVLLQHAGELVDKETLMREVWPDTAVEENNLTVNISGLRKALGDPAANPQLIVTVPGRGYRFAGEVAAPALPKPAAPRRRPGIAAACLAVAIAAVAGWWFWSRPVLAHQQSIAVIPLRVLNAGARNEYLGTRLSDALITRLGSLREITVRPLTGIEKLAGKDPYDVGREAGADTVLEGTIQQAGNLIRVSVRLLRVKDRSLIWVETFDGDSANPFTLEDAISVRVANSLLRSLSAGQQSALVKRYTRNPEAYGNYLRGRYYATRYTEDGFRKGLAYLQSAIDSDPGYALAYSGLADAYYDASNMLLPPADAMPKAKAAAQRAVALDASLAEAHVSLGLVASKYDWNWADAEREFQTALALDPNSAAAHQWYGLYRAQLGDMNRAIAELRRAQELDPLSSDINGYLATTLYWARRYDEAAQQDQKTIDFDPAFAPGHVGLCWVFGAAGRFAEAVAECEKGSAAAPGVWSSLALARANALAGNRAAAEKAIDRVRKGAGPQFVSGYDLAVVYAALGKKDEAFAALDDAYQHRAEWMGYLKIDPQVDALRGDARFAALLQKMGL